MKSNSELTQNQKNLLEIVGKIEDEYYKNVREQQNIAMSAAIVTEVASITNAMKTAITERNYDEIAKLSKNLKQTIEKQISSQEVLPAISNKFDVLAERLDTIVFSVKRDKDKPTQEFKSGIWNPEAGVYKGKMTLQQTSSSNSYKSEQAETPYTYMPIPPTSQYGDIPRSTTPTKETNPKIRGNMKDYIIEKFGELGNSTLATPNKAGVYSEKYMKTMSELTTLADNKNYDEMQKVLTRFENETKGMLKDSKAAEPIVSEIQKEILANKEKEKEIAQAKPTIPTPQKKLERSNTVYGQLLSDEALAEKQKPALPPKISQYGDIPRSPKETEQAKPQFRGNDFTNEQVADLLELVDKLSKIYESTPKRTYFDSSTVELTPIEVASSFNDVRQAISEGIFNNFERKLNFLYAVIDSQINNQQSSSSMKLELEVILDTALKDYPIKHPTESTVEAKPQLRGSIKEDMLKDEQTVKATTSITSDIQKEMRANKEKEEALAKAKPVPTPPKKQEKPMTAPTPKVAQTVTVTQTVVTTTTQSPTQQPSNKRLASKSKEENIAIGVVVQALQSGNAKELKELLAKGKNQFIKDNINLPFDARGGKLADYAKNQEVAKILQENGAKIDPAAMNKLPKATSPEAFKEQNKAQKFASKVTAIAKGFAAKVTADKNNNKGGKVR